MHSPGWEVSLKRMTLSLARSVPLSLFHSLKLNCSAGVADLGYSSLADVADIPSSSFTFLDDIAN